MSWKIWVSVAVIYGIFLLWYFNWSGPVTPAEVDSYMQAFGSVEGSQHTDEAVFRKFLEEDDGGEFVMANLVEFHPGTVTHPDSGEQISASRLIGEYFVPFSLALLKRGGHPVYQARTVGGNIDSWNAEHNASFSVSAMMRYRSRRDLVELIIDPAFADSHVYKLAAIERTISYPTTIMLSTPLRPPQAVLLILLLLASAAQNIVFFLRRS